MENNTLSRYRDAENFGVFVEQSSPEIVNDSLGRLLTAADIIYALEYEALGKNSVFLDCRAGCGRSLKGELDSRNTVCAALRGSSLWQSKDTGLSGAISIKCGCAVHGAVRDSLEFLREWTEDYINHPSSLFTITGVSLALDRMNLSLGHLSRLIVNRLLRLTNPLFTGLSPFLGLAVETYTAVQKKAAFIDSQISHLSMPAGLCYQALTNEKIDLPHSFKHILFVTEKIVGLLESLLALEALSCMKIFQLRRTQPDGEQTFLIFEQINSCHLENLFEDESIKRVVDLTRKFTVFEEEASGRY